MSMTQVKSSAIAAVGMMARRCASSSTADAPSVIRTSPNRSIADW
jgi:hypothetical protein